MQTELQRIPLGIDNFRQIKEGGFLFVDKTAQIADLVNFGTRYYLSRPRRFGKTLLLSMLEELFTHGDEDFRGLAVYGRWPLSYRCQVIQLSFYVRVSSAEEFSLYLCRSLCAALSQAGFNGAAYLDVTDLDKLLALISIELSKAEGRVVLLIDESDYPLTSNLDNKELFAAVKHILDKFYGFVRRSSALFRFVLAVGILRFKDSSVFAGEDFIDISLDPEYAELLGYTENEIRTSFGPHLKAAAAGLQVTEDALMEQLKHWYGGFCFDYDAAGRLYAPWAVNSFFKSAAHGKIPVFSNYWMESSKPYRALRQLLDASSYLPPEKMEAGRVRLSYYALSSVVSRKEASLKALLAQSGYLTIKSIDLNEKNFAERVFCCGFPNEEVTRAWRRSFLQYALNQDEEQLRSLEKSLRQAVNSGDYRKIISVFNEILVAICFDVHKVLSANLYRELIRECLLEACLEVSADDLGCQTSTDLKIVSAAKVYVCELKRSLSGTKDDLDGKLKLALHQLKNNNGELGELGGKEVLRIAAVISDLSRRIERCELTA